MNFYLTPPSIVEAKLQMHVIRVKQSAFRKVLLLVSDSLSCLVECACVYACVHVLYEGVLQSSRCLWDSAVCGLTEAKGPIVAR